MVYSNVYIGWEFTIRVVARDFARLFPIAVSFVRSVSRLIPGCLRKKIRVREANATVKFRFREKFKFTWATGKTPLLEKGDAMLLVSRGENVWAPLMPCARGACSTAWWRQPWNFSNSYPADEWLSYGCELPRSWESTWISHTLTVDTLAHARPCARRNDGGATARTFGCDGWQRVACHAKQIRTMY